MEKAKKVMGEDSREFAVYKRKIGTPRVIGVYAKQALNAIRKPLKRVTSLSLKRLLKPCSQKSVALSHCRSLQIR